MNFKKGVNLITIAIVCFLFICIGSNIYGAIKQNEIIASRKEYKTKVMRFPIEIKSGEYNVINSEYDMNLSEEGTSERFNENAEKIFIDEISTKYSEYIITNKSSYIAIDIDGESKFIEHPVNISENYLNNLKTFMKEVNDDSIKVFPFNDGIYSLINTNEEQYIYNIELGKVMWTRGGYYECPDVNIFNDTLECRGDLSTDVYIFNKEGELIEKKSEYPIRLIDYVTRIFTIIFILFVIQRMVKFNAKSAVVKIIVT
ncbi:MAG: hypothetical protein ACRC7R_12100, partial [Sarcina sp.]